MNIGFGSLVPWWRVTAILAPTGSAAKRLRDEARKAGRLCDATFGRRTRSQVLTDANQVILAAVAPETLWPRLQAAREKDLASKSKGEVEAGSY